MDTKQNKTKSKTKKLPLQINADQLVVPVGVFKQANGTELSQITAKQIAPGSQGVALTNISEALPFFGLQEPVSQAGVALLILEHDDPRLPEEHEVLKVPVQCKETSDPLIIKVAVVQLGHQLVSRNTPAQALVVPEISNAVLRVMVYKDQYPGQWGEFVQSPVRTLMKQAPFNSLQPNEVIDVWDRQFLSSRMSRAQPEDSAIFSVNLRIHQQAHEDIIAANGSSGTYIEPQVS